MAEKKNHNIMLAFVSPVKESSLEKPTTYPDLSGLPYTGVQTNEAAIVYANRAFFIDQLFLVASDYVQSEIVPENNEFGRVTHLEYLQNRLAREDKHLEKCVKVIPYHDSIDMDEALRGITDISRAIMAYAKDHSGDTITLFVDMTGGYRYASMMMLVVMQLLRYDEIQTGHVFYTDFTKKRVTDATSLERVFELVSGAAEFVNFGSVESLMDYFGDVEREPSPQLQVLLQAMQEFSDAIKICRTGMIKGTLHDLNEAIRTFHHQHGDGLEETLFSSIIEVIEREYSSLIRDNSDDISIIRWCAQKGFLQQTMTLCTEWLPAYLVNHRVLYTGCSEVRDECLKQGKKQGKSWELYFVSTYMGDGASKGQDNLINLLKKNIQFILEGKSNIIDADGGKYPLVLQFLNECSQMQQDLQRFKNGQITVSKFAESEPLIDEILHSFYDQDCVLVGYRKPYPYFLRSFTVKKFANRFATANKVNLKRFFHMQSTTAKKSLYLPSCKRQGDPWAKKWKETVNRYRRNFDAGTMMTDYPAEDMMKCLRAYFDLRMERNQVNHANSETMRTTAETRQLIEESLTCIKDIVKCHERNEKTDKIHS